MVWMVEQKNGKYYKIENKTFFYTCLVDSFRQYRLLKTKLNQITTKNSIHFIFRGQSNYEWQLVPTLEREVGKVVPINTDIASQSKIDYEISISMDNLLARVQENDPDVQNLDTKWLKFAYIQHYGGPTRLLDFTKNIDYALFFAINSYPKTDAAIWIINTNIIELKTAQQVKKEGENEFTLEQSIVADMNFQGIGDPSIGVQILKDFKSINIFARLEKQKGIFLYPTNFIKTFEQNLFDLPHNSETPPPTEITLDKLSEIDYSHNTFVLKVKLCNESYQELFDHLLKRCINFEKMFPDVEGLIKNLNFQLYKLVIDKALTNH